MPKNRMASPVKLSKRDSRWCGESCRKVNFSNSPVRAAHIAMYKSALPAHKCHGKNLFLVGTEALGNMNVKKPNTHCKTKIIDKCVRLLLFFFIYKWQFGKCTSKVLGHFFFFLGGGVVFFVLWMILSQVFHF